MPTRSSSPWCMFPLSFFFKKPISLAERSIPRVCTYFLAKLLLFYGTAKKNSTKIGGNAIFRIAQNGILSCNPAGNVKKNDWNFSLFFTKKNLNLERRDAAMEHFCLVGNVLRTKKAARFPRNVQLFSFWSRFFSLITRLHSFTGKLLFSKSGWLLKKSTVRFFCG